jgi:hypothetical protein
MESQDSKTGRDDRWNLSLRKTVQCHTGNPYQYDRGEYLGMWVGHYERVTAGERQRPHVTLKNVTQNAWVHTTCPSI